MMPLVFSRLVALPILPQLKLNRNLIFFKKKMKTNRKFGDSRIGVQSPYERTYHHQDINPSNHISINQSQSTSQRKNGNRSNAKIRSLHHPGTAPRVMSRAPMVHGQRPPPPSEPDAWCSLSAPTRPVRACRGHRAARPLPPPRVHRSITDGDMHGTRVHALHRAAADRVFNASRVRVTAPARAAASSVVLVHCVGARL